MNIRNLLYAFSFGLQGGMVFLLMFFVSWFYPFHFLGILSLILAFQFFLSQISAFGIHFSALHYGGKNPTSLLSPHHFVSVCLTASVSSMLFSLLFPLISPLVIQNGLIPYQGHLVLFCFFAGCNKVYLSQLNAMERFTMLSACYLLKSGITLFSLLMGFVFNLRFEDLLWFGVLLPEILLFLLYFSQLIIENWSKRFAWSILTLKRDLYFGFHAFFGALLLDTSTKVDVLMIGFFTDGKSVSLYGFVSFFSDVILHFASLIRSFLNPKLSYVFYHEPALFKGFIKKQMVRNYIFMVPFNVVVFSVLAICIRLVPALHSFQNGLGALLISFIFLTLSSGFFPMMQVLGQIGRPILQSFLFLLLFASNTILNYILIPFIAIEGAALATGLSYLVFAGILYYLFDRWGK